MLRRWLLRFALGVALFLAAVVFWVVAARPPVYPPPVQVNLASTNGSLQVSPGTGGVLFILPDGSLWRWGTAGIATHRAAVPERVGTDNDWAQATCGNNGLVGVKRDGTLWQAGYVGPGVDHGSTPKQVGTNADWALATKVDVAAAALKTDGTLWTWGDSMMFGSLGDPAVKARADPGQVGTNRWRTIEGAGFNSYFQGITLGGELQSWGQHWPPAPVTSQPTRVGTRTNWIDISQGLFLDAMGTAWNGFMAGPTGTNMFAPALANATPGRYGTVGAKVFEIRPDGTLWSRPLPFTIPFGRPQTGDTNQVGSRTDWVQIWSGMSVGIGLTRDGTLWAWGTDWGAEPRLTTMSRIRKALHDYVNFACDKLGIARLITSLTTTATHRRDETPHAILHLTPAPTADSR